MSKIIALTGAHCSGKTTSCMKLDVLPNVTFIETKVVDVYSKYKGSSKLQVAIAERVYDSLKMAEACDTEFAVIDRCFIDVDAYSSLYDNVDGDDLFAIDEMKARTRLDMAFIMTPLPMVSRPGKTGGMYNTNTQMELHNLILEHARLAKVPTVLVDLLRDDVVRTFTDWTKGI